jgi:hypothetical protein
MWGRDIFSVICKFIPDGVTAARCSRVCKNWFFWIQTDRLRYFMYIHYQKFDKTPKDRRKNITNDDAVSIFQDILLNVQDIDMVKLNWCVCYPTKFFMALNIANIKLQWLDRQGNLILADIDDKVYDVNNIDPALKFRIEQLLWLEKYLLPGSFQWKIINIDNDTNFLQMSLKKNHSIYRSTTKRRKLGLNEKEKELLNILLKNNNNCEYLSFFFN